VVWGGEEKNLPLLDCGVYFCSSYPLTCVMFAHVLT
jgi:hypothetical protein